MAAASRSSDEPRFIRHDPFDWPRSARAWACSWADEGLTTGFRPPSLRRMTDVVCGVMMDGAGHYLACLRPAGKRLGGLWEFPGGKVEAGESPQAALVRELREELAVEVEVGAALTPVIWQYEFGKIRLLPYFCRIIGGELAPAEHERVFWCPAADFNTLEWAPADLPVLDQIR